MKIYGNEFPETLYYDEKHNWGRVEGNILVQGLSDFGQMLAREIVFVELPRVGREVQQGQTFTSVELGKWVGRMPALVSGKVLKVNEELEMEPGLINQSPYEDGWLVEIEMKDVAELDALMRVGTPAFEAFIQAEREKNKKLLGPGEL